MRRRLVYHGRVQGVGFRYTARSIARRHPVSGWVRNLPAGTVELLVEAGADVPTGNHYGRSALHNAAKREDPAVTKFLIAHGARLNQVCEYGTPLDLTANSGIAEVLRAAGGSESATKSIASRTHPGYLTKLPSTE